MTLFSRSGNNFSVTPDAALDIHKKLPVGTYTVKLDEMTGRFYLSMVDGYTIPKKVYGETLAHAVRILNSFEDRPSSTGVLLAGEAGSGKTMLAKMLSLEAMKKGIPTILINEAWCGENFNQFMQQIEQPTVVIFDEFEKVYDAKEQESMLTLLDGVYPSKKLFVLTCNDTYRVNTHMKNRPGRIFYRLDYEGLDRDFITEYCQDNLDNKEHTEAICRIAMLFSAFNFDILKAMVEDMNRYGETPQQVMRFLNASPEYSDKATYEVALELNGEPLVDTDEDKTWQGNPLNGSDITLYGHYGPKDEDGDATYIRLTFSVVDLHSANEGKNEFYFENAKGYRLTLRKKVKSKFDYELAAF